MIEHRALDTCRRAAPATKFAIVCQQSVAQRLIGRDLEHGVQARAHRQPTLGRGVQAKVVDQLAPHVLGEPVGVGNHLRTPDNDRHDRFQLRLRGLVGRQHPVLGHAVEYPGTLISCGLRIAERIIVVRRLRQCREKRRLRHGQVVEWLVEIRLRRGSDPIGTQPEIDLVHIEFEDLVLRERFLDPERQDRLLRFAGEGDLVVQQHILGDLLGDRGRADRPLAVTLQQVGNRRPQDGQRIDTLVLIEIAVLGRHDRLLQDLGDRVDRHEYAPLGRQIGQQLAIAREHPAHDRRLIAAQSVDVRQAVREMLVDHPGASRAGHSGGQE